MQSIYNNTEKVHKNTNKQAKNQPKNGLDDLTIIIFPDLIAKQGITF